MSLPQGVRSTQPNKASFSSQELCSLNTACAFLSRTGGLVNGRICGLMSSTPLLEDRSLAPGHRNQFVGMRGLALGAETLGLKSVHCYADNGEGLKRATLAGADPQSLVLFPPTEQVRQDSPSA